jgi:hypothetical protein
MYPKNGYQILSPFGEFQGARGYLIENKHRLKKLKCGSV